MTSRRQLFQGRFTPKLPQTSVEQEVPGRSAKAAWDFYFLSFARDQKCQFRLSAKPIHWTVSSGQVGVIFSAKILFWLQLSRTTANARGLTKRRAPSRIVRVAQSSQVEDVRSVPPEFQMLFTIDRKSFRDEGVIALIAGRSTS